MRAHYREDPALVDGVGCDFVQLHRKPRGRLSLRLSVSHSVPRSPTPLSESVSQCFDETTGRSATATRHSRQAAAAARCCARALRCRSGATVAPAAVGSLTAPTCRFTSVVVSPPSRENHDFFTPMKNTCFGAALCTVSARICSHAQNCLHWGMLRTVRCGARSMEYSPDWGRSS
jgi:hypothetical protein